MRGSRWPRARGDAVSRSASRLVLAAAALLLGLGVLTAAVVAMREPFALNDYAAIWGLKARALSRSLSLESLFRVDPGGRVLAPGVPAALAAPPRGGGGRGAPVRRPRRDAALAGARPRGVAPRGAGRALDARRGALRAPRGRRRLAPSVLAALSGLRRGSPPRLRPRGARREAARRARTPGATVRLSIFLTLAAWTKPEGLVAALAAAAVLALARRFRAALLVFALGAAVRGAPWALVVSRLAPRTLPTAFALATRSPFQGGSRGASRARLGSRVLRRARPRGRGRPSRARARDVPRAAARSSRGRGLVSRRSVGSFAFSRLRPRVARALVVGPHSRRPARRPHAGARRGSRGMRAGEKRARASLSISGGVPSGGSCPSALRANARLALRRASSSVSSGSAPSLLPSFFPSGAEDERKVRVRGGRKAERPLKRDLARRGIEEVRAAHDLASRPARRRPRRPRAGTRTGRPRASRRSRRRPFSTSSERGPKRRSSKVKRPGGTRKRKARAAFPAEDRRGTCRDRSRPAGRPGRARTSKSPSSSGAGADAARARSALEHAQA